MSASAVAMCGSPVKVKQLPKRHSSSEDVISEVRYDELCMAPPSSCSEGGEKKICLCAPTKHAGSFRCRLHRAHSHKVKQRLNTVKHSRHGKLSKDVQADSISPEDVEKPLSVLEE